MSFLTELGTETEGGPTRGGVVDAKIRVSHYLNLAAWLLLAVVAAWVSVRTLGHHFESQVLSGDQASFLLQTMSLALDGPDLSFDALDFVRWKEVDWASIPSGLFFQSFSGGWAFAKPYGYSLFVTPFYRMYGPASGVAIANTVLLWALIGLSIGILRQRWGGPIVPLTTLAFVFASNAYFHAFPIVTDLFIAVLVGCFALCVILSIKYHNWLWILPAAAITGFLTAEKTTLAVALLPLLLYGMWRLPVIWHRVVGTGVFIIVLLIAMVPYLYYSDGVSWNAYSGDRYYGRFQVPFQPMEAGEALRLKPVSTGESFTVAFITDAVRHNIPEALKSTFYYMFGRHTGLIVSFPLALIGLGLALTYCKGMSQEAMFAFIGIILYVGLYVLVYPSNYYGGAQSIGNRYFLQVAPLVLVVISGTRIPYRSLIWIPVVAIVFSLVFFGHAHMAPESAFNTLYKHSPAQSLLPFESNQTGANFWGCGSYGCERSLTE